MRSGGPGRNSPGHQTWGHAWLANLGANLLSAVLTTTAVLGKLRAGQPSDIAETAYFLASGGARHITGQTLHVNGGAHTTR